MKNEFDMQAELAAFKDPKLARGLIESIARLAPPEATLMEVCGTHTVAIARNGTVSYTHLDVYKRQVLPYSYEKSYHIC